MSRGRHLYTRASRRITEVFDWRKTCASVIMMRRVPKRIGVQVGTDFAAFQFVLEAERAVFSSEGLRRSSVWLIPSVEGRVRSLEALNPSVERLSRSMEWLVASVEGLAPLAEGLVPLVEGLIPSTKRKRQFVSVSRR